MPARIAYAVGLAVAIALAACYDVPKPDCGFTCGPPAFAGGEGTCPSGYTCFTNVDNRCHRDSPPFLEDCPGDAGMVIDLVPPMLTSFSPLDGATDVALDATIQVVFDEPVDHFFDGSFSVTSPSGDTPGFLSDLPGSDFQTAFRWTPQVPLHSQAVYTVTLSSAITDGSQNHLTEFSWSFTTTTDTEAPTAVTTPSNGQTNVFLGTTINVDFSEPVMNVNGTTFQVSNTGGAIAGSISGSQANYSFQPATFLQPATQYTISLSNTITDLNGNALVFSPRTFTTQTDAVGPSIQSPSPQNGQTGVSVKPTISIGFNEPVTGVGTSSFTLTGPSGMVAATVSASSQTATLTPLQQLQPLTNYSYTLTTAVMDLNGNPLQTAGLPIMFTTNNDIVSPSIVSRTPSIGATGLPVTTTVIAGFDENVTNADATTVRLFQGATQIPASVTYSGAPLFRATLTPDLPLAGNTTYTVQIGSTLQDAFGNQFGTPPGTPWTFTTGADTVAPHILSNLPADNATNVAPDAEISVTFDEPVTMVDGTSFVVMNAGTGTLASSNGGRTWTFTPTAALPANTTITILLTTAIQDSAGNALGAPFSYDFTTAP